MRTPGRGARIWRAAKRWLKRMGLALAACVAIYLAFLLLGFVPICRDYVPPPPEDRVRIFVRTNEIHTDIVVPIAEETGGPAWRSLFPPQEFHADVSGDEWISIGWGSRKFFIETPTWSDLTLENFCLAMFTPNEAVLHVEYLPTVASSATFREVWITRARYRELAAFLRSTVGPTNELGAATLASNRTYGCRDRFFEATGTYHLFNTCNQWTGRGLAGAGVPTGLWTPLKEHVLWRLP